MDAPGLIPGVMHVTPSRDFDFHYHLVPDFFKIPFAKYPYPEREEIH